MANSWSHHLGLSRPRTWPLISDRIGSVLPLPLDRLDILWPAFWLVIGLSASFAYRHAANFTPMTSAGLPHPLFPTQAVILSVLLTTSSRHWWLYLVAYYAALVLEGIAWSSLPTWYLLVSNVANVIEPLVGALLLRHFIPLPPRFSHLREVGVYVACVTVAAAIGATWGATTRAAAGFSFVLSLRGWFLGDVLASLLLAPTILLCVRGDFRLERWASRRAGEAALLFSSLLIVASIVFGTQIQGPNTAPALLYLPVPFLVWAAVRFGPPGLMCALSLTTVLAVAGVVNGLGPFVERPVPSSIFNLQLFLLGVGVPLFCLAALVLERQRAQARMEQSEERYRTVVRNLPRTAVLLFGPDLRHLFADGQELTTLGLDRASAEGKTLPETFPADVAAALAPGYRAALAGSDVSFDLLHAGRTYQAHALPVSHPETIAGMMVMQDVTEQRRIEMLTALDQAKSAFLNSVSHEFRTPLTLLLGPIQELLASSPGTLSPEDREQLEIAHRNGLRLLKLVNTLLDVSRLEAGRFEATYMPTDLGAYTAELASTFRSAIEQAGLDFVVNCPPLPEPVYVDRDQWERIVLNLLSNALKFTLAGEIVVTLGVQGGEVVLTVTDSGVGIGPDDLPHLFDPFHQASRTPARIQEGTGIGLALVQELAKLHGGRVGVTSAPGQGSTFTVAIPRGSAHLPADRIRTDVVSPRLPAAGSYVEEVQRWLPAVPRVTAESSAGGDAPDPVPAPAPDPGRALDAARSPRMLVVEDNADLRTYLTRLLEDRGAVEAAGDGASALQIARAWKPDLILADVMMPGLDGFAMLEAIRADPQLRSVSVILLSAWAGDEIRARALRAGADDYVVKPVAMNELLARVDSQLWLARMRSEAWTAAERERLAFDLHDSATQSVYSVTLLAEAGRRAALRGNQAQVEEYLSRLGEAAQRALRELRLLVNELRPLVLSDLGLVSALEHRLDSVERRAGLIARLVVTGELSLPRATEEAFYYIAQEALNNALKHAHAKEVVVRISGRPSSTELTVTDDGCGFDAELASKGGGVGLASIQERARRIGATATVGRRRRGGTQVTVRLTASGRPGAPVAMHESGNPNLNGDACPDRSAS
jgi:signal transduction histidine kinase